MLLPLHQRYVVLGWPLHDDDLDLDIRNDKGKRSGWRIVFVFVYPLVPTGFWLSERVRCMLLG